MEASPNTEPPAMSQTGYQTVPGTSIHPSILYRNLNKSCNKDNKSLKLYVTSRCKLTY
jgi:hypothetical protein